MGILAIASAAVDEFTFAVRRLMARRRRFSGDAGLARERARDLMRSPILFVNMMMMATLFMSVLSFAVYDILLLFDGVFAYRHACLIFAKRHAPGRWPGTRRARWHAGELPVAMP